VFDPIPAALAASVIIPVSIFLISFTKYREFFESHILSIYLLGIASFLFADILVSRETMGNIRWSYLIFITASIGMIPWALIQVFLIGAFFYLLEQVTPENWSRKIPKRFTEIYSDKHENQEFQYSKVEISLVIIILISYSYPLFLYWEGDSVMLEISQTIVESAETCGVAVVFLTLLLWALGGAASSLPIPKIGGGGLGLLAFLVILPLALMLGPTAAIFSVLVVGPFLVYPLLSSLK